MRAILNGAVNCVAAEPRRFIIVYRVVSEADQDYYPATHAHVLVWNMMAFTAGFKPPFFVMGTVALRVVVGGTQEVELTSFLGTERFCCS